MRELITAVLKIGGAAFANLLINAITVKIIAMITGPAGVGVWSLLRQCQQTAVFVGTFNGGVSFVRGISQLSGGERSQYMRTVAITYLLLGTCVTVSIVLLSNSLASWIGTVNSQIFALLAVPVAVAILRDYLLSLLNGLHAIGRLALVQIFSAVAAVLVAYPVALLVARGNYSGFVFLMFIVGVVSSLAAIYFIWRSDANLQLLSTPYWTPGSFRRFAGLAGIMATTGIFGTVTIFAVRVLIVRYRGINEAGFFDVAWSLGLMYVGLLLNAFGTYYLPKLSTMSDHDQVELIGHVAKLTVMAMTPLVVFVTIIKPWIITMFYSTDFLPALGIFQWMLIADYFKMSAWIFSVVVVARGLEKPLLIGSVLWDFGLLVGAWLVLQIDLPRGAIGVVTVILHCFSLVGYYRLIFKKLPIQFSPRLWIAWLAGLICVVGAVIMTWNATKVDLLYCWPPLFMSLLISWACLTKAETTAIIQFVRSKGKDSK